MGLALAGCGSVPKSVSAVGAIQTPDGGSLNIYQSTTPVDDGGQTGAVVEWGVACPTNPSPQNRCGQPVPGTPAPIKKEVFGGSLLGDIIQGGVIGASGGAAAGLIK